MVLNLFGAATPFEPLQTSRGPLEMDVLKTNVYGKTKSLKMIYLSGRHAVDHRQKHHVIAENEKRGFFNCVLQNTQYEY